MNNLELRSNPLSMSGLAEKISAALASAGYQNRADALTAIESGRLEYIEFPARVFAQVENTNHLVFSESDMPTFAASFAGQPHLRNHNTRDIDARDGTTSASGYNAGSIDQMIRLTTRRGMADFVEGKIDRFSIGWRGDALLCTICNQSWFSAGCSHRPGQEYDTASGKKKCQLLTVNPRGKETSSVNDPAVESETGLLESLESMKLSINGISADDHHQKGDPMFKIPKPMFEADKGAGASPAAAPSSAAEQLAANQVAMDALNGSNARQQALNDQLEASNKILAAQCSQFLTTALQGSRLPEVVQTRLRRQFDGRVFEAPALQAAIDEARAEVSALTAGQSISGPGRGQITGVFGAEDEYRAAVDDLLGAERETNMIGKKVRRLSGIREAYLLGTGDVDFHGGFDPLAALQFMLGGTATFPGIVKDSLNKMLIKAWVKYGEEGYDWWKDIVTVEHFDTLNTPDWVRTGTIGSLPTVAEGIDYSELPIGDNVETSTWYKYGGYIELTLEAILRDNIGAFKKMPGEVALGALRNISEQVAAIFTATSNVGPTMADTGALFNNTPVTTAGGHANLLTTALGTDYTAWKAVSNAMFKQPMLISSTTYGTGKRQAFRPKFCLVPVDLSDQAFDLFNTRQNSLDNKNVENRFFGKVFPLVVPEWTDTTDWAAVANPNILPGIMIGEIFGLIPSVFVAGGEQNGAMFANDSSRIKVRQFLNVGVADWRALHKNNVA